MMKGVWIHCYQEENPYILFLHGWGLNASYLKELEKETQSFANSVLIDLPGFGENSPLDKAYDMEDYLFFIKNILEENHIKISMIVGHSFGGKVAMYYASRITPVCLLLLAPSIVKKRKSWKEKLRQVFLKKHQASRDYLQAKGYLRSTLVRMVHRYPVFEMKRYNQRVILFGGLEDEEVTISQLKEAHTYLKNSELWLEKGNHFAYQRYVKEIAKKIKKELCL